MLTPSTFLCKRCADCCRYLTVKLSKKDIEAIKDKSYKEDFFIKFDRYIKSPVLKNKDEGCVFLGKKEGKYYCKIYNIRPKVCRKYPFVESDKVESCKPKLLRFKFREKKKSSRGADLSETKGF